MTATSATCCAGGPSVRANASRVQVLTALSGGLLSSSCCVLQLALNLLPVGCAGFSSVLTPLRPYLRALTLSVLAHMLLRNGLNRRTGTTLALSLSLMLSQDAVAWHNRGGAAALLGPHFQLSSAFSALLPTGGGSKDAAHGAMGSGNGAVSPAPAAPELDYFHLRVEGIKCEGCALRLKEVCGQVPGVTRCIVNRETHQVLVWVQPGLSSMAALMDVVRGVDASYLVTPVEA